MSLSLDTLVNLLIGILKKSSPTLTDADISEYSRFDALALDSLSLLQFLTSMEDYFNLTIPTEEASEMKTIHDAASWLKKEMDQEEAEAYRQ